MSKGKSITLLTIISVLMALLLAMTFVRFPMGVKDYNSLLGAVELDYGLTDGVSYTLTLSESNEEQVGEQELNDVVDSLKLRLEALGYENYIIKTNKSTDVDVEDFDIRIEIKETDSCDSDIGAIITYGELKFYGGTEQSPTTEILKDVDVIEDSQYIGQTSDGEHLVSMIFTPEGREALLEVMENEETYYLRIACGYDDDGNEISLFDPTSAFDVSMLDNGNRQLNLTSSSAVAARQIALQIKYGGIDYKYDVSNNGVGVKIESQFGADIAIRFAVAIITLVILSIVIFIIVYKGIGIITSMSTILFILGEAWLLIGVPGILVNLGSVIGIIASTIVCLYGMIVLSQNVKNEFTNSEKTAKAAIKKGFNSAFVSTVSSHVVCGIFALLLFIFTKGLLYSFAITFGIGVIVSFISTTVFTRMFNSLIFPIAKNKEKFLRFSRVKKADGEV